MSVVIGNAVALIGSLIMVYSGVIKDKLKIIYVQTVSTVVFTMSNIILGGITGAIVNVLSCIRNILCYKNKLGFKEKIIISAVSIALSLSFNNLGIIGLLPLISAILYIWLMNIKDVVKFKILIIITMILWLVYDISIKSYVSAIFDFATIVSNFISIVQIKIKNNKYKSVQ